MGKSKSVENQIQEERVNQQFIDEIQTSLRSQSDVLDAQIQRRVQDFYRGNGRTWSFVPYLSGGQFSFELEDTWNFDNLQKIIDAIGSGMTALLPGGTPVLPEGTKPESDAGEINRQAGINENLRVMVVANCTNLFTGILNSFGTISSVQVNQGDQSLPLGQGLRIFSGVGLNSRKDERFFRNKVTIGYYYLYYVYYSIDEFAQQVEQTLVAQYERTLIVLNIESEKLFNQYLNGDIDFMQYIARAEVLEIQTKRVLDKVNELRKASGDTRSIWDEQIKWLSYMKQNYAYNKDIGKRLSILIDEAQKEN
jgi:hypothetical protein